MPSSTKAVSEVSSLDLNVLSVLAEQNWSELKSPFSDSLGTNPYMHVHGPNLGEPGTGRK
jgi:hypothetical protein